MTTHSLPPVAEPVEFASELIKARTERGLTQSQLSTASGVSLSAIKSYEAGRNMPGSRELRELCQALEISPNKLLFGVDLPFKATTLSRILGKSEEPEPARVAATRLLLLMKLLASDERNAILTLMHSLAIARHGDPKVQETLIAADIVTAMTSELSMLTGEGKITPEETAQRFEDFLVRQGHSLSPVKLPKK